MSLVVRARAITLKGKDLTQGDPVPKGIPADQLRKLQEMGAVQDAGLPLPGRDPGIAAVAQVAVAVSQPDPEPYDAAAATDAELQAWLIHVKPVAEDTIAAAKGDPNLAKRIAAAEEKAEKPRKGVIDALGAITDQPA